MSNSGGNPLPLIFGAGLAAVACIKILPGLLGGKSDHDGLDSIISYSSRLIAAARAMEAEEEEPIVNDPLAATLAGKKALNQSRKRQQPAPKGKRRKYKVNKMAIRTKWFDDQLLSSLGMPLGSLLTLDDYIVDTSALNTKLSAPKQVVVLGSGMDTRPWRLKLPAGLAWFEIDQADVLAAKELLLSASGAEVDQPTSPRSPMQRPASMNALLAEKIGTLDHHVVMAGNGGHYPMRAETWTCVAADLNNQGWLSELRNHGFDPRKNTIWLVEGLLMYLSPERARELMEEMTSVSAPGSVFLANNVMDTVVETAKTSKSELMSTWQFGWPQDVGGLLNGAGWELKHSTNRAKIANSLRLPSELCSFPTDPTMSNDRASLFVVATVKAAPSSSSE